VNTTRHTHTHAFTHALLHAQEMLESRRRGWAWLTLPCLILAISTDHRGSKVDYGPSFDELTSLLQLGVGDAGGQVEAFVKSGGKLTIDETKTLLTFNLLPSNADKVKAFLAIAPQLPADVPAASFQRLLNRWIPHNDEDQKEAINLFQHRGESRSPPSSTPEEEDPFFEYDVSNLAMFGYSRECAAEVLRRSGYEAATSAPKDLQELIRKRAYNAADECLLLDENEACYCGNQCDSESSSGRCGCQMDCSAIDASYGYDKEDMSHDEEDMSYDNAW
jgi:hypothetical protein